MLPIVPWSVHISPLLNFLPTHFLSCWEDRWKAIFSPGQMMLGTHGAITLLLPSSCSAERLSCHCCHSCEQNVLELCYPLDRTCHWWLFELVLHKVKNPVSQTQWLHLTSSSVAAETSLPAPELLALFLFSFCVCVHKCGCVSKCMSSPQHTRMLREEFSIFLTFHGFILVLRQVLSLNPEFTVSASFIG